MKYLTMDGKVFKNKQNALDHEKTIISTKLDKLKAQLDGLSKSNGRLTFVEILAEHARIQSTLPEGDSFLEFTDLIDDIYQAWK